MEYAKSEIQVRLAAVAAEMREADAAYVRKTHRLPKS